MRKLTSHIVNPANDKLTIAVLDQPGCGGANHRYDITGFDTENNPIATDAAGYKASFGRTVIVFQNGPINEVGVNGITHEALLAILEDRLVGFQSGKFANDYNAKALEHVRAAQAVLQERTRERMARQVEGTHAV